jgi:hypothetical protein
MRALASFPPEDRKSGVEGQRDRSGVDPAGRRLIQTGTEQSLIPTLGTGQGLWRIKNRSFVVQHQMHPAELELFDTTGRMTGAAS